MRGAVSEWERGVAELSDLMNSNAPFAEKAEKAVAAGTAYLGVEHGHLTRIVPELDHWEVVASTDAPGGSFPPGQTASLQTTFCRRTIEHDQTIALHDVPNQGWEDDVAYETYGLRCHLSTPITLDDNLYGTLCFVSEDSRSESFTDDEVAFVEMLAQILEYELALRERDLALSSSTKLIDIFSRILRHNLRNDLSVIRGHVDLLIDQLEQPQIEPGELTTTIEKIITLTEKSRELKRIAQTDFELQEQSITPLFRETIAAMETEYSNATIELDAPEDVSLISFPTIETAFYELVENALTHTGDGPTVTITVESSIDQVRITVADDGPGLPDQEAQVLQGEPETSLEHGSGVGLWIVQWVIASHDGSIETDASGDGTTVTVSLPRPTANEQLVGD